MDSVTNNVQSEGYSEGIPDLVSGNKINVDFDRINEVLGSDKLGALRNVEPSDFDRASDGNRQDTRQI